ncbi:MAG: hypothetical protein K0R38_5602 [Polyangiaceae bacterium]|nr:hypothetical protein [Polyangiaceae bacterium]
MKVALRAALLASSLALHASGKPPKRDPPLLFGGPVTKVVTKAPLDPRLPTGPALAATPPRPLTTAARCSFTRPVCVHATSVAADGLLPAALSAMETAYERTVLVLGIPAPIGSALDFYVSAEPQELTVSQEPLELGHWDRAAVFCRGGASGALLDRQASLCVGEAVASALDAGESPEARRALSLELWWIGGVKTSLDVQAVDDAQRHPEAPLSQTGGYALLLDLLETTRSAASPGLLSASMYSAAASRTSPGAALFDNEPDLFDVLRHSLDEELPRYTDLMVDFALRRALAGDRDDGTRFPSLGFAGSFVRPHFDWVIPFSTLPRRVLSGTPVAPSGTQLIWLELDDAPMGAAIGFRAEWEAPVAFQWRILLVDREGREVRRFDVPFQERARSADARVLRLDSAKAIIIAGVNVGGVDLAYPFDPDIQPFEPAACTVYLVSM